MKKKMAARFDDAALAMIKRCRTLVDLLNTFQHFFGTMAAPTFDRKVFRLLVNNTFAMIGKIVRWQLFEKIPLEFYWAGCCYDGVCVMAERLLRRCKIRAGPFLFDVLFSSKSLSFYNVHLN